MLLFKQEKKKAQSQQNHKLYPYSPPNNIKVLKVSSFNFDLKSYDEKLRIIESFGRLLNSLNQTIQIICKSEIINPNDWIQKGQDDENYQFLNNLIKTKRNVKKNFYVVCQNQDESELEVVINNLKRQLKNIGLKSQEVNIQEPTMLPYLKPGFIKVGDYYYETIIIKDWPYTAYSGFLSPIYNLEKDIDISMFIHTVDNEEAIRYLEKKIAQFGSSIIMKEEEDNYHGQHEEEINSALNMFNEIIKNEGKFFHMSFYITVKNASYIELKKEVKQIKSLLKGMMIKHKSAFLRQDDGFRCSLAHGIDYLQQIYNFTTNSLKHFFPFISSNIMDKDGIMMGVNLDNGSLIFLNHFSYFTASMIVIGKTGSGKSFTVKSQIDKMISQGIEVTILDTENDYGRMIEHEKYKNNPNFKVVKYETIDEYEKFLINYVKNVDQSYMNKVDYKPRFLVIEEFWKFMKNQKIAEIIQYIIKTGRKRWLGLCAITQEVEDLLKSEYAKSIINNCSIKILLKQEQSQKDLIKQTFCITDNEWNFILTAEEGEGILFADSKHVRFKTLVSDNQYKLLTTKPQEIINL